MNGKLHSLQIVFLKLSKSGLNRNDFIWRYKVNEKMKRLIEVLNSAGYEVITFEDRNGELDDDDGSYRSCGVYELKVFDTSIIGQSKP
jgi:predicted ATPase